MEQRYELADELGVIRQGRFYEIKRFIERPLKAPAKSPRPSR